MKRNTPRDFVRMQRGLTEWNEFDLWQSRERKGSWKDALDEWRRRLHQQSLFRALVNTCTTAREGGQNSRQARKRAREIWQQIVDAQEATRAEEAEKNARTLSELLGTHIYPHIKEAHQRMLDEAQKAAPALQALHTDLSTTTDPLERDRLEGLILVHDGPREDALRVFRHMLASVYPPASSLEILLVRDDVFFKDIPSQRILETLPMTRRSLLGADLSGLDLTGLDFEGADLQEANLDGCTGNHVSFRGAQLQGASLEFCDFDSPDLRGAVCGEGPSGRMTSFSFSTINHTDFRGADLKGVSINFTDGSDVTLGDHWQRDADGMLTGEIVRAGSPADLSRADMTFSLLDRIGMGRCQAEGVDLCFSAGRDILATGATLADADLDDGHFPGLNLEGADARRLHAHRADLRNARAASSDLEGAHLAGCNLSGAELQRSQLRHIDWDDTRLDGANLRGADCDEADIRAHAASYQGTRFGGPTLVQE